jgi:3-deoxy-D-arabino-heptulosonate 7-phosphate (DAHP) synthase class II
MARLPVVAAKPVPGWRQDLRSAYCTLLASSIAIAFSGRRPVQQVSRTAARYAPGATPPAIAID